MARFFVPENFTPSQRLLLSPEESKHLSRVLRLTVGDEVEVANGKGRVGQAVVQEASPKESILLVTKVEDHPPTSRIQICFGVPKGTALDFIVRKCAEVGVERLQPLITEHCTHPSSWNDDRWSRVLSEVAKQCQDPYLPEMGQPLSLSDYLRRRDQQRPLIMCDEAQRDWLPSLSRNAVGYDILVGAEGGWSEGERNLLKAAGAIALGLGKNRLRAETAALASLVVVKFIVGELSNSSDG